MTVHFVLVLCCYVFLLVALSCCEEADAALALALALALAVVVLRCGSDAAEELGVVSRAGRAVEPGRCAEADVAALSLPADTDVGRSDGGGAAQSFWVEDLVDL